MAAALAVTYGRPASGHTAGGYSCRVVAKWRLRRGGGNWREDQGRESHLGRRSEAALCSAAS